MILKTCTVIGAFVLPLSAIGSSVGMWVYQVSYSGGWAAISAGGFVVVNLLALGAVYGKFSTRLDTFEGKMPLLISNAILQLKDELRDTYQTRAEHHVKTSGRGAGQL